MSWLIHVLDPVNSVRNIFRIIMELSFSFFLRNTRKPFKTPIISFPIKQELKKLLKNAKGCRKKDLFPWSKPLKPTIETKWIFMPSREDPIPILFDKMDMIPKSVRFNDETACDNNLLWYVILSPTKGVKGAGSV